MARLTYAALMSVDGYVADPSGRFDWAMPDETVHAFINDLERPIGTHLYGRRMYEVMSVWETITATDSPAMADYADIWRAAEKVVYSATLTATTTLENAPGAVIRSGGGVTAQGGVRPVDQRPDAGGACISSGDRRRRSPLRRAVPRRRGPARLPAGTDSGLRPA